MIILELFFMLFLLLIVVGVLSFFFFPALIMGTLVEIARVGAGLKKHELIVDGRRWHYLDNGVANKPIMVLVHGFGSEKDHWANYARLLKNDFRLVIPDLPGFGESERDTSISHGMREQAQRLHDFLAALGLKKVHMTGNSMGGFIAGRFAQQWPDMLESVTFMNSAGVQGQARSNLDDQVDEGDSPLVPTTIEELDRMMSMVNYKPINIPTSIKKYLLQKGAPHASFLNQVFKEVVHEARNDNLSGHLHDVNVPALVLWGEADQLIDVSCAHEKAAQLPNAKLVIMTETGHVPMMEKPAESARHQIEFVKEYCAA